MATYFTCKFLQGTSKSKNYTYKLSPDIDPALLVAGGLYNITNENGYKYKNAVVEVTAIITTMRDCIILKEGSKSYLRIAGSLVKGDIVTTSTIIQIVPKEGNYDKLKKYGPRIQYDFVHDLEKPILDRETSERYSDPEEFITAFEEEVKKKMDQYIISPASNGNCLGVNKEVVKEIIDKVDPVKIQIDSELILDSSGLYIRPNERNKTNEEKKEKKEKTMKKMFGNLEFGKYTGNELTYSINGLAYKTWENNYVTYDKETETLTNVNEMTFDIDGMIYLMPVAIDQLKIGDIIKYLNNFAIVTGFEGNKVNIVYPTSKEIRTIMPERSIFGFNFVTKAICLFGDAPLCGADTKNPFGNMLPFFLMEDKQDSKALMMAMMLSNQQIDFTNNPLMLMLLWGDKENFNDILPLLMLSGNTNFFGTAAPAEKVACDCDCDCKHAK